MEGLAIALLLAWGVAAVRPVAEFQADVAARPGATPNPVAERFVAATEGFDASLPGRVGKRTNPIANSSVFVVIDDFLVVMADPQARAKFESDPLFDEIGELPSVRQAFDTLRTNPEIEAAIERGVVAPQLAGDLLRSEAVLRVIRDTPVVDEVTPYVDRIAEALREARETVGEGGP